MIFDHKCPFCHSGKVGIVNNDQVAWGNDEQGVFHEDWECKECGSQFQTETLVEVSKRTLQMNVSCPYCGDFESVKHVPDDDTTRDAYACTDCKRLFWIRPEEYYQEGKE